MAASKSQVKPVAQFSTSTGFQHGLRPGDDMRLVEHNPPSPLVPGEQRREEGTLASAHIHHSAETAKVVGRQGRIGLGAGAAGHGPVKHRPRLGMTLAILPWAHPLDMPEGVLPRLTRIHE